MESFVVRVWVPGEDEEAGDESDLRGVVEKVATGEAAPFHSADELADILRARSNPDGRAGGRTSG